MSAPTAAPRRKWPWILIAVIIVAAIIVLVVVRVASGGTPTVATPTDSPTKLRSTPISDASPTGCLGGSSRDAAMVLKAQSKAPDTSNGAVEVAAAFTRWIQRYPYPSASDATTIQKSVLASNSFTDNLVDYLAGKPDLSGGIVPAGETYYMSTVPGVWNVESASSKRVVVTVGTAFVVNGAVSSSLRSSITVTENWQTGGWHVANVAGKRTTEELFSIGHPFTGGC
jgi:hypothetical protein